MTWQMQGLTSTPFTWKQQVRHDWAQNLLIKDHLNLIDWLTHSGTINLQIHSKFLILIKLNAFPLLSDKPVDLINQIKKAGMKVL